MPSSPIFSIPAEIQKEYDKRKQVNSMLGLQEQYKYVLIWCKMSKASNELKKQAVENFKLLAYREWLESYTQTDNMDDADWRKGIE